MCGGIALKWMGLEVACCLTDTSYDAELSLGWAGDLECAHGHGGGDSDWCHFVELRLCKPKMRFVGRVERLKTRVESDLLELRLLAVVLCCCVLLMQV